MLTCFLENRDLLKLKKVSTHAKCTSIKRYRILYIPQGINIRYLLAQDPVKAPRHQGNIYKQEDKVAMILHTLASRYRINKDSDINIDDRWVKLSSKLLQKSNRDYTYYLKWLEDKKIIEIVRKYKEGESQKYRFTEKWRTVKLEPYVLCDKSIIKKHSKSDIKIPAGDLTCEKLLEDLKQVEFSDKDELMKFLNSPEIKNAATAAAQENIELNIRQRKSKSIYKSISETEKEELIKLIARLKINSWEITALNISDKQYFFKRDDSSGRLHTNVVQLKKEFRKFLRIKNNPLVACDIKNSQPLMSLGIFLKPKELRETILNQIHHMKSSHPKEYDIIRNMLVNFESENLIPSTLRYIELVQNGQIYEFMARELSKELRREVSRDAGKIEFFNVLFNPPRFKNIKGRKIMKKHFPQVLRFFSYYNASFKCTRKQAVQRGKIVRYTGNNLARLLQRLESNLVIDIVCMRLKDAHPDMPLITLHDGIATTVNDDYPKKVKGELEKAIFEKINLKGQVVIEWDKWK